MSFLTYYNNNFTDIEERLNKVSLDEARDSIKKNKTTIVHKSGELPNVE